MLFAFCIAILYWLLSGCALVIAGAREQKSFLRYIYFLLGVIGFAVCVSFIVFAYVLGGGVN
jgi:uncharacterized membrane protein